MRTSSPWLGGTPWMKSASRVIRCPECKRRHIVAGGGRFGDPHKEMLCRCGAVIDVMAELAKLDEREG